MGPADLAAELRAAIGTSEYLEVRRRGHDLDVLAGYCVGVGSGWFALNVVSDEVWRNGHAYLRLADVTSIENRGPVDFVSRREQA